MDQYMQEALDEIESELQSLQYNRQKRDTVWKSFFDKYEKASDCNNYSDIEIDYLCNLNDSDKESVDNDLSLEDVEVDEEDSLTLDQYVCSKVQVKEPGHHVLCTPVRVLHKDIFKAELLPFQNTGRTTVSSQVVDGLERSKPSTTRLETSFSKSSNCENKGLKTKVKMFPNNSQKTQNEKPYGHLDTICNDENKCDHLSKDAVKTDSSNNGTDGRKSVSSVSCSTALCNVGLEHSKPSTTQQLSKSLNYENKGLKTKVKMFPNNSHKGQNEMSYGHLCTICNDQNKCDHLSKDAVKTDSSNNDTDGRKSVSSVSCSTVLCNVGGSQSLTNDHSMTKHHCTFVNYKEMQDMFKLDYNPNIDPFEELLKSIPQNSKVRKFFEPHK